MKFDKSVRALLASAGQLAKCKAQRAAWVRKSAAEWRKAQRDMDDLCTEAVRWLTPEAFHRLFDEEQAKVDAIRGPLQAAAERDLWPRDLYWGCI